MKKKLVSLDEALGPIQSGSTVAIGGSLLRRQPNAAIRALIRLGIKDLTVQTWASTTAVDMLAAAGAIRRYEGIYAGMFGFGLAPNFRRAVQNGEIEVRDFSETAMVARLRAAGQGLPSLPIKTLFGSDIALRNPEQFREYNCPISGEKLLAVQAAYADFTIIHGYVGDEFGNVQWPIVRDSDDVDMMMGAASKRLIVTVEKIVSHDEIKRRPALTYIPGHLVEAIVEVPYGAHPVSTDGFYDEDEAHLERYLQESKTPEGIRAYLDAFAREPASHEDYIAKVGGRAALAALNVKQGADA
ncbi:glutaconate CoA-transferase subunit A [Faunimonas pinastri]|uniref:Glutaconate CoA-transferase subunit A n=1 Tax=Faunimonas pinastri TaxID=1855383 RepID=A0A1H9EKF1_9HYPH|nr:CoA-transferase [Faunimonas pinastri]SEQ26236.1 glutaconate CoA-transferase subunit A [Faunimonas pinastri]